MERKSARGVSEEFQKSVIYQILPQVFTQEGTIKKAEEMLPHIASLGVDVVYLCPIVEYDDDTNQAYWSVRQKRSKTGNPKNPYRLKDYFKIEPMLGSDADLDSFVKTAHKLGLKVVLDLVYYHCGPTANMIKDNPDFVKRNPDGSVKNGRWNFPEVNFDNPKLREYLIANMEYFINRFGVDGYRTDVEGAVPADFWAEAYARISKLKANPIMIAESNRADAQVDAYDANYCFEWQFALIDVFSKKSGASELERTWKKCNARYVDGARFLRNLDNHDTASDSEGLRFEKRFGHAGMNAVQVINFTMDGIPMIYNGNEIADDVPICMFSTNKHGRYFIAWENAMTAAGRERESLIRKLINMRHDYSALSLGTTTWLSNSAADSVISYTRNSKWQNVLVVVNTRDTQVEVSVDFTASVFRQILNCGATPVFKDGKLFVTLKPYAYLLISYRP